MSEMIHTGAWAFVLKEEAGGFLGFTFFPFILQSFLSICYVLGIVLGTKETIVNTMGEKSPVFMELTFVCVYAYVQVCACTHTHVH